MAEQTSGGVSLEVSADATTGTARAKAEVSDSSLGKLGRAAAWLFPRHDARSKVMGAIADRLSRKLSSAEPLDEQESQLLNVIVNREAVRVANQADVAERTRAAIPEVADVVRHLPQREHGDTTDTFMRRAETIAGDIHEEDLRDLFARILAGEVNRPGAFSIRTLEAIRALDPKTAAIFNHLREAVFDCQWVLEIGYTELSVQSIGITAPELGELRDAGLLTSDQYLDLNKLDVKSVFRFGPLLMRICPHHGAGTIPNGLLLGQNRLTTTGRQIATVLPPVVNREYFFKAGRLLHDTIGGCATFEWREDGKEWQPFVVEEQRI